MINNELFNLLSKVNTTDELREINTYLISKINILWDMDSREVALNLRLGQEVSWNGKRGFKTGRVLKINRTKAIVEENVTLARWNIPMSMLKNNS